MSYGNRGPTPSAPVYTTYPGGQQGSTNYGFYGDLPQAPPPKYEDVVGGACTGFPETRRQTQANSPPQPSGAPETVGFVLITPTRTATEKLISSIVSLIFVIVVFVILFSTGVF